jgi:hypothetical protein
MRSSSTDVQAPFLDFKSSLTPLFHGLDEETQRTVADVGKSNKGNELQKGPSEDAVVCYGPGLEVVVCQDQYGEERSVMLRYR